VSATKNDGINHLWAACDDRALVGCLSDMAARTSGDRSPCFA